MSYFYFFPEMNQSTYQTILGIVVDIFFGINSSINPIIYFAFNKSYRKAFTNVFIKRNNQRYRCDNQSIELSAN